MKRAPRLQEYDIVSNNWLSCFQDDTNRAAGDKKEEDEIGDLDDLLRREREMEKKGKESAPIDAEV